MTDPLTDFAEPSPEEQSLEPVPSDQPVSPPRRPRPGLGLALVIVLAIPAVHFVCMATYIYAFDAQILQQIQDENIFETLQPDQLVRLMAFDQGMFLVLAFLGVYWAFGSRFGKAIPFASPPLRHVVMLLLLIVPLAVVDLFVVQQMMEYVKSATGEAPSQGELPMLLDGLTNEASLGTLLFIIAIAPAFAEELLFRGVIGRGLVGRRGLFVGVVWTSLLFSIVHLNPVQAVGVFFVGLMCHIAYLATKTLWAPILLHFFNNALVAVAMKSQAGLSIDAGLPAELAMAAALCVIVMGVLIWNSRVQFRDENGDLIPENPLSVERPHTAVSRECQSVSGVGISAAVLAYLMFFSQFGRLMNS